MKKVVALCNYSDNYYIFREGMIYNLTDDVADIFINKGVMSENIPDDIVVVTKSTTGTEVADIKINGQSNKIYASTGSGGSEDPGYSIEKEQYIEEQTLILDFIDGQYGQYWEGTIQGGSLPESGTIVNVTINGVTKKCEIQDWDTVLGFNFSDTIYIEQDNQTGVITFYSDQSIEDNEVTISAYSDETIIPTEEFKTVVQEIIQENSGYFIQNTVYIPLTSFIQERNDTAVLLQNINSFPQEGQIVTVIIDGENKGKFTVFKELDENNNSYFLTVADNNDFMLSSWNISASIFNNQLQDVNIFIKDGIGNHTVEMYGEPYSATITPQFKAAVEASLQTTFDINFTQNGSEVELNWTISCDKTFAEIQNEYLANGNRYMTARYYSEEDKLNLISSNIKVIQDRITVWFMKNQPLQLGNQASDAVLTYYEIIYQHPSNEDPIIARQEKSYLLTKYQPQTLN